MKKHLLIVATIALLIAVVVNIDWKIVAKFTTSAPVHLLITSYLLYLLSFAARALRWKIMLKEKGFFRLYTVVAIHTMANNLYPARTGELSFIYLLGKRHSAGTLTSVLLTARIADMLCIALFFILSTTYVSHVGNFILIGTLTAIGVTGLFGVLIWIIKSLPENRLPTKVRAFKKDLAMGFSQQKSLLFFTLLSSLAVWSVKYLAFYCLTKAIFDSQGLSIDFWHSVFGISFSELTTVLPIHSLGGFGTFEAGWAGAYMLMGYGRAIAVTTGLVFHVLLLSFSILTGLPFLLLHNKVNK